MQDTLAIITLEETIAEQLDNYFVLNHLDYGIGLSFGSSVPFTTNNR